MIVAHVQSSSNAITIEPTGVLEGSAYLDEFNTWIPDQAILPASDHYVAFTA